jgi:hypothetical protein
MLSGVFMMISLSEIALAQYFRINRSKYSKAMLRVEKFSFPLTSHGRPLAENLMASGTIEGELVRLPLNSLKMRILKLPRSERARSLRYLGKEVPGYWSSDPDTTGVLFNGRSLRFVEADYFENGHPTANAVFALSLVASCFLGWQARVLIRRDRVRATM